MSHKSKFIVTYFTSTIVLFGGLVLIHNTSQSEKTDELVHLLENILFFSDRSHFLLGSLFQSIHLYFLCGLCRLCCFGHIVLF